MDVDRIDHLVLYVEDIETTCEFYERAVGAETRVFDNGFTTLQVGDARINLHPAGDEWDPHARNPARGAGDFCLITGHPIEAVVDHLGAAGIEIIEGPAPRNGALGEMTSVYVSDPDGNLVEIAAYDR